MNAIHSRLSKAYRLQIAELDRIIRLRTEDLAELTEKKARLERNLQRLEETITFDDDTTING
jgi:hypothetical protein